MSDDTFRTGDKITLEKGNQGWRIEVLRGAKPDGSPGGIVGNPGYGHADPEAALVWLRNALGR